MATTNETKAVINESIGAVIASMVTPYVAPPRTVVRTYRIEIDGCAEWLVAIEYEKTRGDCWKPTMQYVRSISNLERFHCVTLEKMDKTMNKYGLYWLYIESTESGAHDDRVQTHGVLRLERGASGREEDAAHQDAYEVAF